MIPENCAGQRRNHILRVRLTPGEDVALEKMAQDNGTDISGLVREVLFNHNPFTSAREEIQSAVNGVRERVKRAYSNGKEKVMQLYDNIGGYVPMEPEYAVANMGYQ